MVVWCARHVRRPEQIALCVERIYPMERFVDALLVLPTMPTTGIDATSWEHITTFFGVFNLEW